MSVWRPPSVGHRLEAAPPHPLLSKANHLAGHFPAKQGRKCLVDLFQRDLTRDHLIEFQLAVQIHINVAWHVDTKTVRAHARTLNRSEERRVGKECRSGGMRDH